MNKARVRRALLSARELAAVINNMSEDELQYALEVERDAQRRPTHLERMVTRLAALKAVRIKDELVREFTPWIAKNQ